MNNKRMMKFWLLTSVTLFSLFLLLQVPAAWLLKKFAPELRHIHNVNGNIWTGQADWQTSHLKGTIHWNTRPWELIRLRTAANVTIHSGQTQLDGIVSYGLGKRLYIKNLQGEISPDTLSQIMPWQWPATHIKLQDVNVVYQKQVGFNDVDGQMTWAGGALQYTVGPRNERLDVPPLIAQLTHQDNKFKIAVQDSQKQRMADLALGADQMLDIQITQRFLLHSPSYKGQAGMDTAVITTRQPLHSLGGM